MDVVRGSMRVGRRTFLGIGLTRLVTAVGKWIGWGAEWHLVRMRQAPSQPAQAVESTYC